jgi:hypothetical protein
VLISKVKGANERHMNADIFNMSSWVIHGEFPEHLIERMHVFL